MPSYYLPDITGTNTDYLQVNVRFKIRKINISLAFENSPVFAESLRLATTDGRGKLLTRNVDWIVSDDDIDETAMSRALLEDPGFSQTLIKSFTIISQTYVGQTIAATFQEFYLTTPGRTSNNGDPIEFSPELLEYLVTGLADAKQQLARVASPVVPYDQAPTLLPFDINAEFDGNIIEDEVITINTVIGAKVIRFTQGAFFADSVTLTYNGQPLNPQTDYIPVSISALTKQSTNRSGIYQYILVLKETAGEITGTYHAVGGEVQPTDMKSVLDLMVSIKTFLNTEVFVTAENIVQTPAFRAFDARLRPLETYMRNLQSGAPTYGDATGGSYVRRPVSSPDANFHWWSIAKLYKIQGSDDVVTADQFRGRVFFPSSGVTLAFIADVNFSQIRQPLSFKTETLVFDPTYTLFGDTSTKPPVYPMVRLVYSNVSQSNAGAILQIGIPLPMVTDQMVVEDLSTTESCWLLDKSNAYVSGQAQVSSNPVDDNFALPDGATIWSSSSASSKQIVCVPQFNQGYLAYTGSNVQLSQTLTTASTENLFNVVLPGYFPLDGAKSLILTLQSSSDATVIYDVEIPLTILQNGFKSGNATFATSGDEVILMSGKLKKNSSNVFTLSLNGVDVTANNVTLGNSSNGTTSDIIRYVRVKA